ncbi:putative DYW domain-containing protein [Medicago truncatula]|uniref:Putative DYW domain-containing protein n=1 Tax=Medicago truncatula TaxID=3880 RepID=A0A396JDQ2_MEDTR|nr:putative DYW domain-containing protein [Medicago truncatula]
MALAFELLSIPQEIPSYTVRNLRIYYDCHTFVQLVSKVYNGGVIIRHDCFHNFHKGFSSCTNYW